MPRLRVVCFALVSFLTPSIAFAEEQATTVDEVHGAEPLAPLVAPPPRWAINVRLGSMTPFGAFGGAQAGVSVEAEIEYRLYGPIRAFAFGEHDGFQRGHAGDSLAPSSEVGGIGARLRLGEGDFQWLAEVGAGLRVSRFSNLDVHGSANGYELRFAIGPSFRLAESFRLDLLAQAAWMKPTSFHDGIDLTTAAASSSATTPASGVFGFSVGGSWSL